MVLMVTFCKSAKWVDTCISTACQFQKIQAGNDDSQDIGEGTEDAVTYHEVRVIGLRIV